VQRQPDINHVEEWFQAYADDVYRYARYMLHGLADPRDVVQEVFLRAIRHEPSFRHDAKVKTWLLQITRNYVFDLYRKKRTEANYWQLNAPRQNELSVPLDSTLELEDLVAKLKLDWRQVFILRVVEGLPSDEVATVLGWSEAKVRTTLHRALKQLRADVQSADRNQGAKESGARHFEA